jgi:hypothetical protein
MPVEQQLKIIFREAAIAGVLAVAKGWTLLETTDDISLEGAKIIR